MRPSGSIGFSPEAADKWFATRGGVATPSSTGSPQPSPDPITGDWTQGIQWAMNQRAPFFLPPSAASYKISAPIAVPMGVEKEIILPAGSALEALPPFAGESKTGKSMIWTQGQPGGARNVNIRGTGRINCNGYADRGLFLKFAIGCLIDGPRIDAAKLKAIHIGDPGQSTSFEVTVNNVLAYNAEAGSNEPSSIGVDFENASDCVGDNIVPIGYRTGIRTAVSTKLIACHPWTTRRYGKMTRAFDIAGARNKLIACFADTPTNFGDGNDAYGFFLRVAGSDAQLAFCEGFLAGVIDDIQQGVDNEAYGYWCESNSASPMIFGGSWASAVANVKWKSLLGSSNVATTLQFATILGVSRDGRSYADNLSDNLPIVLKNPALRSALARA